MTNGVFEDIDRGQAFIYGSNARRYGMTKDMCPFPENSKACLGWLDGWHYEKANQEEGWRKNYEVLTKKREEDYKPGLLARLFNFLFRM